jgi:hypothetical protein
MEMPLRLGRGLTERDTDKAPKVVVINETAARKYFPGENPVGRHFGSRPETAGELEIVGVIRDAKYNSIRDAAPPTMYVPYVQSSLPAAVFQVRTAREPASALGGIREVMRQIDPNLPMMNVSTQADEVEKRLQSERAFAQAYTLFGALALLLASLGLFDVLTLILGESMTLVLIGVVIGVATAIAGGRLVATLLFGLAPTDAATMAGAVGVLLIVAATAGYVPARRAAGVDPLVALRYE